MLLSEEIKKMKNLMLFTEQQNSGDLDEMEYPMPSHFEINHFKSLKSYSKRIDYCNRTLKKVGAGTSRIVYQIDDYFVLKLAKNEKGLRQNESEAEPSKHDWFGEVIATVKEFDQNDEWIISELAKRASVGDFKRILGIDFKKYSTFIDLNYYRYNGKNKMYFEKLYTDKDFIAFADNPFCEKILTLIIDFDLAFGDFSRINSYGVVKRDGKDVIVCVDYGVTNEILSSLYHRH